MRMRTISVLLCWALIIVSALSQAASLSAFNPSSSSPSDPEGPFSDPDSGTEELSLFVINVGKADSLLLRCGGGAWLIDTGRGRNVDTVLSALNQLQVSALDGIFITHMDSDHVGGLKKLLKSDIPVDTVYIPAFYLPEDGEKENPAVKAAEKSDVPVIYLQGGDSLPLGSGVMKVLGPLRPAKDKEDNNSLVLLAEAAGGSMLLAGDMEFPEESDLLSAGAVPEADVLKIANHGDSDATSEALISMVRPRVAVISTSTEEKPSTPASRVLKLLKKWGTDVYVTQDAALGILVTLRSGELSVEMR